MSGVRAFFCGTHYMDWRMRNCDRCAKDCPYDPATEDFGEPLCEIEAAISKGAVGDGTVPEEIGRRMAAHLREDQYTWDCPERELTGEEPHYTFEVGVIGPQGPEGENQP